jgi:hypothetical protein
MRCCRCLLSKKLYKLHKTQSNNFRRKRLTSYFSFFLTEKGCDFIFCSRSRTVLSTPMNCHCPKVHCRFHTSPPACLHAEPDESSPLISHLRGQLRFSRTLPHCPMEVELSGLRVALLTLRHPSYSRKSFEIIYQ